MMPLIIEFIGLPGAGKTTITQHVLVELRTAEYRCFSLNNLNNPETIEKRKGGVLSKLKTFFGFLSASVVYKRIAINAFKYSLHVTPFSFSNFRRAVVLVIRLNEIRSILKGNYDLVVLDQGLIQNIWSIAAAGDTPKDNKYLDRLLESVLDSFPSYIIYVDVGAETAMERIKLRRTMRSRFDRMSTDQAKTLLARHKELFEHIVNTLNKFPETGFLFVDGQQSIEQNVSLIAPVIEQTWQAYST